MRKDSGEFNRPHQIKGTPVSTRFGLRKDSEPKPLKKEASVFSYSQRGRGPNGESSN